MTSMQRDNHEDGEWVITLSLAIDFGPTLFGFGLFLMIAAQHGAAPGYWGWLCPLFAGIAVALAFRLRAIARKGGDPSARGFRTVLRAINWSLCAALLVFGCLVVTLGRFVYGIFFP